MRLLALSLLLGVGPVLALLPAQAQRSGEQPPRRTTKTQRVPRDPATHAPQPELPPTKVMQHLRRGNAAATAARAKRQQPPPPARRPSAAGRYVCAVFACADADLDVATALGLRRQDVLVFSNPGPFVHPESVALLEHHIKNERLALVLVLTHDRCQTLATKTGETPRSKALAARVAAIGRLARRDKSSLPKAMARHQREALLGSSRILQQYVAKDRLRILPASIDSRTLRMKWHTTRADELPMAPIK